MVSIAGRREGYPEIRMEPGAEGKRDGIPVFNHLIPLQPATGQPVGDLMPEGERIARPGEVGIRDLLRDERGALVGDPPRNPAGKSMLG